MRGEGLPLSAKKETYKDLTFKYCYSWKQTRLLTSWSIRWALLFLGLKNVNILIIIRGRSNRGKRKRVAIRLRIGYDFTIPGEISLGRAALMTESLGFHGCQTWLLPGEEVIAWPGRHRESRTVRRLR